MRSTRWTGTVGILLMLMMAAPLGAAADPGDNGGPGNSGAAHQCQKGGWQNLAPAEDPSVAFANQDACVSHGAQGGELVRYTAPLVAMVPYGCGVRITFPGLEPGWYSVFFYVNGGLDSDSYGDLSDPPTISHTHQFDQLSGPQTFSVNVFSLQGLVGSSRIVVDCG